ncbi:hypothetical protein L1049_019625 [Liquidambar formosana]|uniref:Uncharacterized protein n=1 Tax=Liquidambar formosana TaxID=63359 RepID=A0AAP0SBZ7_LIQFO
MKITLTEKEQLMNDYTKIRMQKALTKKIQITKKTKMSELNMQKHLHKACNLKSLNETHENIITSKYMFEVTISEAYSRNAYTERKTTNLRQRCDKRCISFTNNC